MRNVTVYVKEHEDKKLGRLDFATFSLPLQASVY